VVQVEKLSPLNLPHLGGMLLPQAEIVSSQRLIVTGPEINDRRIDPRCQHVPGRIVPLDPLPLRKRRPDSAEAEDDRMPDRMIGVAVSALGLLQRPDQRRLEYREPAVIVAISATYRSKRPRSQIAQAVRAAAS
jgi:hypothetical protein